MTFTEAAVEVLRLTGKPLHYKKITEIAIEKNLLSHVGKTPETTMSSRLATMVKKDRGDAPIIKVKPGVFALRDQPEEELEESPAPEAPETEEPEASQEESAASSEETTDDAANDAPASSEPEEEPSFASQELPGAEVFPEEEDDDELILANLDDEAKEPRRTRKRRPRRRRERDDARGGSDSRNGSESRASGGGRAAREPRREPAAPARRAAAAGEAVGRDLADAVEQAVRGRGRHAKPLTQVAESLINSGRLSGAPADLAPTLAAAVRGDIARRQASGERPRFRLSHGAVGLLEWDHPLEAVRAEQDAVRAAERQQESVRRAFIKRLRDLPDGAMLELLATWLNAVGVQSIRAVRADAGDFSLAGVLRRGPEETPLAITIYRGRGPVTKDAVVALRGALHQFDHARIGWLIALGPVKDDIRDEASAEGAAPCAVFDGDALAQSMEDVGVGIQRAALPLSVMDVELLEALGGASRGTAQSDDESEGNGNKRRRSRRRGRRRGGSDAETEDQSEQEPQAAKTDEDAPSSESESEPPAIDAGPEPSEDKEKLAADGPADAPVELEQV
ncbi:MAG: winged helix-turn-helix domain-containing protein [Myxococcota bacterium]